MEVGEALARLKFLVNHDRFYMVQRQSRMAMPVSVTLAKEIVRQLSINDFVKHEPNRNNPLQFVWVWQIAINKLNTSSKHFSHKDFNG